MSILDRIGIDSGDHAGANLLTMVRGFVRRFTVLPDAHCLVAVTLWIVHTHLFSVSYTTARLAILSVEKGSGKTRLLEILGLLVHAALFTFNASPATIFRQLAKQPMTLLLDEADTIWTSRGKDDENTELRGLLNAGYKRGAQVLRCVGPHHEVATFPVFCPVALAGIGELPETILSRSIIIRMRRRLPAETVEPFRDRLHDSEGEELRNEISAWAASQRETIAEYFPELPPGVEDRNAEVWEPLVAIADLAGGDWPRLAREACTALVAQASDSRVSLGVRLLADVRTVFAGRDAMSTKELVTALTADPESSLLEEDAPWSDLRGKPVDARRISSLLRPYAVKPAKIRVGTVTLRGYRREDLYDAWQRYLPPLPSSAGAESTEQAEQTEQASGGAAFSVPDSGDAPDRSGTLDLSATKAGLQNNNLPDVPDVPDFPRSRRTGCIRCRGEGCGWCQ